MTDLPSPRAAALLFARALQRVHQIQPATLRAPITAPQCRPASGKGMTDNGVPVIALITRIAVERISDQNEFERDLLEVAAPSVAVEAWPSRMLLN